VIFRREPIHKQLAREARLDTEPQDDRPRQPAADDSREPWGPTGVHGIPRPRRWDAVASAEAPGLTGDEVHFVALPGGDLVVDEDEPADSLGPLADAVEQTIEPPYRAEGIRRRDAIWAVAARRIRIAELEADGDDLALSVTENGRTLTVDGSQAFGSNPELERLADGSSEHYVMRARRLDGNLWEIEADPL
jgi:hypothetical protein